MPERDFQREDIEQIKAHGLRALVASAPGTGKSLVAIRSLVEYTGSLPALVICPASVIYNWTREWKKWAPGVRAIPLVTGSEPIPKLDRGTVLILSWALLDTRWEELVRLGIRSIVADEAHLARNPDALRSQALWQIVQRVPHLLLLSGTPIVNNEGELGVLKDLLGPRPFMVRRLIEDVAKDIPPKTRSYIQIQLPEKQRENYDKANEEFEEWLIGEQTVRRQAGLSEIEIERTLAAEAFTKVGYLRRLVGEYKVPAAVDWVSRAVRVGEPVVVFCEHQNVLSKLSKGLRKQRIRHGVLDGATSIKDRQKLIDDFQKYRFPVFLGTRAAKEGITLTVARHLLFVERFFTSADEEQAEDRIRRITQIHPTTIWYLHAVDTIDDRVDQIVRGKRFIIRTAIGSAKTAETPTNNVVDLLRSWGEHTRTEKGAVSTLGTGDPLPALPSPTDTHAIVFSGDRWQPLSALRWCRMNGYDPAARVDLEGKFRLVNHPALVFKPQSFSVFSVSKDIRIIVGSRLSKANERKMRRSMKG
jgi:SNF2 family DNA or RNA helicase